VSGTDGRAWTDAGYGYAAVWIALTVARRLSAYGRRHRFQRDLGLFLLDHRISVAAFADSIMFLTLAPVASNRLAIQVRSRTITAGNTAPPTRRPALAG
jgi:hypothetical protein